MNLVEILLSPICGAIGLGGAVLYHLIRTKQIRHNLSIQLSLLHNCPVGLVYIKKNRVLVNKTFCLLLDTKHPHRWKNFLDLFSQETQRILSDKYTQLKNDKIPFEETFFLSKKTFRVRGQMLGAETCILWWIDMTSSRKRVLKEEQKNKILSEQKSLLESAWEAFPFPAFIRGNGEKALFANQAVGKDVKTLNTLHWVSLPFSIKESTFTLTYGQETHTEEELQSLIREVAGAHQRLCMELPCAVCLFGAGGQLLSCSHAFADLWHLDEKWIKSVPSYEDFLDTVQEKGLMNRVMDFAQYKKQQRSQFAQLSETQEVFLYLPNGKIIRRLMIPFASGGIIFLDEDKTS